MTRMNWISRTRTGRLCLPCPLRRNGKSTAARRRSRRTPTRWRPAGLTITLTASTPWLRCRACTPLTRRRRR
uniref:Dishevelled associated activator of morphogenesis 2 n=1 Tax=Molossus molossus TaxID=27622 RepID=A0A7J8GQ40_MOLMO|nr:dishevelled associated activator of morphogenesis 2 [Molossus molossus]